METSYQMITQLHRASSNAVLADLRIRQTWPQYCLMSQAVTSLPLKGLFAVVCPSSFKLSSPENLFSTL